MRNIKKGPKVSVLMPAYNAEKYISESIASILNQSFKDFEFIILEDQSQDDTFKKIKEYEKKDKRIKIFQNRENKGIAGSRNFLLSKATGQYIAWQDADDISMPKRLEKQIKLMDGNKNIGICGGFLEIFKGDNILGIRKYKKNDKDLRKTIFRYSPVAQPTSMIRKSIIDKVGLYDLKMPPAEDLDMSFKIGKLSEFGNVQEITLKYREHNTSATYTRLKTIEINTLKTRLKNINNGYKINLYDIIYNVGQYISIFIIPPKLKIRLFNLIRNNR